MQKESSDWLVLLLVNKMGPRQKAIKVFLAVCDDHAGSMDPRQAYFLDEQDAVALLFFQEVAIGDNERTYKNNRAPGLI
jgi:hypothetical protein